MKISVLCMVIFCPTTLVPRCSLTAETCKTSLTWQKSCSEKLCEVVVLAFNYELNEKNTVIRALAMELMIQKVGLPNRLQVGRSHTISNILQIRRQHVLTQRMSFKQLKYCEFKSRHLLRFFDAPNTCVVSTCFVSIFKLQFSVG